VIYVAVGSFPDEVVGTVYTFDASNEYGHECYTYTLLGNSGYASPQQILNSGYCNTDTTGIWGFTQVTNTAGAIGPQEKEGAFHQWYQSEEGGSVSWGGFEDCLQNPVGQHSTYICPYIHAGPGSAGT